jgi:hypothetical protein
VAALSGCQRLGRQDRPRIGLVVRNYTDSAQPLGLSFLREDRDSHQNALVFREDYTVPAPGSDRPAGTIRRTDVVPERRYLVRVLLKNGRFERFHAHYRPDESTAEPLEIRIYRDETTADLYVDFRSLP